MKPELDQTRAFLLALTSHHDQPVTFQCFDDSPEKRLELARILHGTLAQCSDQLADLNDQGAGVFVTVNETDLRGRREENIVALRALFVDVDDGAERTWALTPDILVRSARGVHAYWLLTAGEDLARFQPAQKQLAAFYRTDGSVTDLPRVMRLPGFQHRKGEPVPVRLEYSNPEPKPRTIAEVLEAHPAATQAAPAAAVRPAASQKPVSRRYALAALQSAVERIHSAPEGERNNTLNREAFGPGQLVAGGALDAGEAISALLEAAVAAGLSPAESRQTIESAFLGALASPRSTAADEPPPPVKLRGRRLGAGAGAVAAVATAAAAVAVAEPAPGIPHGWQEQLVWKMDARGNAVRLENCLANAMTILHEDPRWVDVFWLDEFAQEIAVRGLPPYETNGADHPYDQRPLRDDDYTRTAAWLQREFRLIVGVEIVAQAIGALAHRRMFHPVREYLHGLSWDGTERLSTWLQTFCGACGPDSPDETSYVRDVGRAWMISAVARVERPGCKADHVLILEGRQGIRKSTVFRKLFSPWFTDEIDALGTKDAGMQVQGAWGIELSELDALGRSEIARTKAFLSKSDDRFRPPYGRTVQRFDRQCVFAGTVNHSEYLRDETGHRRFWPVRCHDGSLDVDGLAGVRDQLWAEALAAYRAGEPWWLQEEGEGRAAVAQDDRASIDVWEDVVSEFLEEIEGDSGLMRDRASVSVPEVLKRLNVPVERQSRVEEIRVGRILRHLGWEKKQVRVTHSNVGNARKKRFFKVAKQRVTPPNRGDKTTKGDAQATAKQVTSPSSPLSPPFPLYARVENTGEVLEMGGGIGDKGDGGDSSTAMPGSRPPVPFTCDDCGGSAYRLSRGGRAVCTACWGE